MPVKIQGDKARVILALRTLGWTWDDTRDAVKCAKQKVGAVERWFERLSFYDAAKFVMGDRVNAAWNRLKLHEWPDEQPPSAREIMDKYHHDSAATYGEDIRDRLGWTGDPLVWAKSSTSEQVTVVTDLTLPPAP